MNIELQTNDSHCALRMVGVQLCSTDAFRCLLTVRSNGFALEEVPFWIGIRELKQFCQQLHRMNEFQDFETPAVLYWDCELDEITFSMSRAGHVFVRGDFRSFGQCEQRLQFAFETDQTVLTSFVTALEALIVHSGLAENDLTPASR